MLCQEYLRGYRVDGSLNSLVFSSHKNHLQVVEVLVVRATPSLVDLQMIVIILSRRR